MRLHLVVLALTLAATASHAQGIAGKWAVTWDSDIAQDHDTAIVKKRSPATLELTLKGDSAFGVWNATVDQGTQLRGTFDGKTLRLTTGTNERAVKRDGVDMKMKVRWDFTGAPDASGSKLAGTLFIYLGDRPSPPRRWEAIRTAGKP